MVAAKGLHVTVGAHDLRRGQHTVVSVSELVAHPDYDCRRYHNDIALLRLQTPLSWSAAVMPACFPGYQNSHNHTGKEATVAGWGWTDENYSKGKPRKCSASKVLV